MRAGRSVTSSDGWSRTRVATDSGYARFLVAGAASAGAGTCGCPVSRSFSHNPNDFEARDPPPGGFTESSAWRAAHSQVAAHAAAQRGQRLAERDDALELVLAAAARPLRVVPVLLAPARVPPGRLQVAVGVGADPDIAPCRRNRQRTDPRERARIAYRATAGRAVHEPPPLAVPAQTRLAVGDIDQSGATGIARVTGYCRGNLDHPSPPLRRERQCGRDRACAPSTRRRPRVG